MLSILAWYPDSGGIFDCSACGDLGNFVYSSSSQAASSYVARNPQPQRGTQPQPARGRDEGTEDTVSADVEEVCGLNSSTFHFRARPFLGAWEAALQLCLFFP